MRIEQFLIQLPQEPYQNTLQWVYLSLVFSGAPFLCQAGRIDIRGHCNGEPGNGTQKKNDEYKSHNPFDHLHRESPLAASIYYTSISFLIEHNKYIRQPIP